MPLATAQAAALVCPTFSLCAYAGLKVMVAAF